MNTEASAKSAMPVEVKADTEVAGDTELEGAESSSGVSDMDRDRLIDIADEVYHAHDDDEEEMEEEWENSFDAPR